MKLLIQSAMIFFGTLMAAAVVALGEPAKADVAVTAGAAPPTRQTSLRHDISNSRPWIEIASVKNGYGLR
jgi:hypothetical protein